MDVQKIISLDQLGEHEDAKIQSIANCLLDENCAHCKAVQSQSININETLRDRMFAMGLVPGACVQKMGDCPLKDPIIVRVNGCCMSLRKEEASLIFVEAII